MVLKGIAQIIVPVQKASGLVHGTGTPPRCIPHTRFEMNLPPIVMYDPLGAITHSTIALVQSHRKVPQW